MDVLGQKIRAGQNAQRRNFHVQVNSRTPVANLNYLLTFICCKASLVWL
jgi:hypothetical protein